MNASRATCDVLAPLEPPRVHTSKLTKWAVALLFVAVCGTPSLGLYWLRQHYQVFDIPAESMEPTIRRGDRILVDMQYFRNHLPAYGEIIVFKKDEILLEKRVAAVPGDTIEGRNDVIYLNGNAVSEPYVQHIGIRQGYDFLRNFGPTTLKKGEYFVLGDNRDVSLDSRDPDYGPIPLDTIVGRPLFILSSAKGNRAFERIK